MAPILQFKAGRSFRQGETNQVVSQPDRGLVYLEEEDGLLHFYYKDITTSQIVEDLIIFPGDASFKIANKPSRVSVLKFNSSSARHFFWHQDRDLSDEAFEERGKRVNELIGGEEEEAEASSGGMQVEEDAPATSTSSATTSAPAAPTSAPSTTKGLPQVTDSQNVQLQNILSAFSAASANKTGGNAGAAQALENALRGARSGAGGGAPEFTLPDVLPTSTLTSLLSSLPPASLAHLSSFLPPSLPTDSPSSQLSSLTRAVTSPEFRRATNSFDRALRTGATGPVVRSLGMERGEEGVEEFLQEVQRGADREKEAKGGDENGKSGDDETMKE